MHQNRGVHTTTAAPTRNTHVNIEIQGLLDPGDESKTLQKVGHIEHLTVLDEDRDNKRDSDKGGDDVANTLERVQFGVWKDDATDNGEKVVGRDAN